MRLAVSSATALVPFSNLLTVAVETLAWRATSSMVALSLALARPLASAVILYSLTMKMGYVSVYIVF